MTASDGRLYLSLMTNEKGCGRVPIAVGTSDPGSLTSEVKFVHDARGEWIEITEAGACMEIELTVLRNPDIKETE